MKVTKQEFKLWLKDPMTIEVFEALEESRKTLWTMVHDVEFVLEDKERYIRHLGQIEGIELLLEIKSEDIIDEEEEEDA